MLERSNHYFHLGKKENFQQSRRQILLNALETHSLNKAIMTIRQKLGIAKKKLEAKILEVDAYLQDQDKHNEVDLLTHLEQLTLRTENFQKHLNELEKSVAEDTDENERFWKDYEIFDDVLSTGEAHVIKLNCIKRLLNERKQEEAEERAKLRQKEIEEKSKQLEMAEKEKQRLYELEKLKIEMSEKEKEKEREMQLHLERMRIEADERKLKIQTDEAVEREKINIEKLRVETREKYRSTETEKLTKSNVGVRLPKLELKKFDGDVLKWREFWDTYESTIHTNPSLQNVDKFKYLKCHLTGQASDLVAGIDITNVNYDIAINLLEERYNKSHVMREVHYSRLINLQPPSYKTSSLRAFHDETEKHIRALNSLGINVNTPELLYILKSKLPRPVLERLQQQKDSNTEWTMEIFRKEFQSYVGMKEDTEYQLQLSRRSPSEEFNRKPQNHYRGDLPLSTGQSLVSNEKRGSRRKSTCIFCEGNHWSDECPKYTTIASRKDRIKGRCFLCFNQNHQSKECNMTRPCYHCGESTRHHRSLCPQKFPSRHEAASKQASQPRESGLISVGEKTVMQTALVQASNPNNSMFMKTRILLDSGSNRTYITKELSEKLQLREIGRETVTTYTFGCKKPKNFLATLVELELQENNGKPLMIQARVVPHITGSVERTPINASQRKELEGSFKLSDTLPTTLQISNLGLLIGNDYYYDIILPEKEQIADGLYLVNSIFGWILTGRTSGNNDRNADTAMFVITRTTTDHQFAEFQKMKNIDECQNFEADVEALWTLETIGINNKDKSEKNVLQAFKESVKMEDGRYQVSWPWKEDEPNLPDNYELCNGRLKSLYKRLSEKPQLLNRYDETIKEQLAKNVIEKAPKVNEGQVHYIPHHVIVQPEKDKIRIVYDASAKTKKNNQSLNECLYRGPVILEDLAGLLMRFRTKRIGVIADIEKAFLQISLKPPDRDVTRFLWLKDINRPPSSTNIETYRFTRVPFGINSSPFLLAATIQTHLEKKGTPEALQIRDDIYVDNLITGADSQEMAKLFYTKAKDIFKDASMNLRDWKSNSMEFNNSIPLEDKIFDEDTKVLGINWKSGQDTLHVIAKRFNEMEPAVTKRQVLTTIASLFDPLGLLSPATIEMKLFLQKLWINGQQWDDELSDSLKDEWKTITAKTVNLDDIAIPRFIGSELLELLCFCDASGKAYATAIYLRSVKDGKVVVNLVFAKSRVAPKKELSIPRLELLSVLIGCRSLEFVKKQLKSPNIKSILWTDSMCALSWIKGAKTTSVFVNNRISEITQSSNTVFKYINTRENPADLPTRGMSIKELLNCKLWWYGPPWLLGDQTTWPNWNVPVVNIDQLKGAAINKTDILHEFSGVVQDDLKRKRQSPFMIDETRSSSLKKLLRVTAYANRFIQHLRGNKPINTHLSAEEIDGCEKLWIKYVQGKHFLTEQNRLTEEQRKSQLNPGLDNEHIVRVHGRFANADLPEATASPILLPRREHFTKLLIEDQHNTIHHSGTAHTLAAIRQRFWIPQGRAEVKSILRRCLTCIKHQGGPYRAKPMAPWPKSKVTESKAFLNTGLDYFGPLFVKQGKNQLKYWVCLFTCVTTRAIHLELVEGMSAEQFLFALRRFIARRGKPNQIILDNAIQFKAAKDAVDLAWEATVKDPTVHSYLADQRIVWSFIIELSPWMGGFYERLVGTTKMALKKSIGKLRLTSTQLQTVLAEIEATLNSRPLIYISGELDDQTIITPGHFLSANSKTGSPHFEESNEDPDYRNQPLNEGRRLLEMWKKGNKHLDQFWEIWRNHYLLNLRERSQIFMKHSRKQSSKEPQVGDIVQIKDPTPRGSWRIGKITELLKSQDSQERAAKVTLANKHVLQRSLVHLYPLEVINEDTNDQEESEKEQIGGDQSRRQDSKCDEINPVARPRRKAKGEARDKILGHSIGE